MIGIDISKSKVDCAVLDFGLKLQIEKEVVNKEVQLKTFILGVIKTLKIEKDEIVICCENTGIYGRPLQKICAKLKVTLWVEHALKIKRASTDMRGKDDKKDALRIAQYCVRYIDRIIPYQEASEQINKLNVLVRARDTFIAQKIMLQNQLKEAKTHDRFEYNVLKGSYKAAIARFEKSISKLESEIKCIVEQEDKIKKNKEILTSIPGVGTQTAIRFIIATGNFTRFESAAHLACYVGVVPFKNESGTVVKKPRVSKMSNKNLKKILHMAAISSVSGHNEFRDYFDRKVAEGKNKMCVINAIRNKIVLRMVALIKRQQLYQPAEVFLQKSN